METVYELETFTVKLAVAEPAGRKMLHCHDAVPVLRAIYSELDADQEHLVVLFLDQKNRARASKVMFTGCQTSLTWHPAPIFRAALLLGAVKILTCHNHPSGDCAPSPEDIETNRRLKDCGKLMGVELVDDVILGRDSSYSFAWESAVAGILGPELTKAVAQEESTRADRASELPNTTTAKAKPRQKTDFESIKDFKDAVQALKGFVRDMTARRLFELSLNTGAFYGYDQSEDLLNLSRVIEPGLNNEPECWGSIPNVPMDIGEDLFAILIDTRDAFLTIGIFLGAQAADPTGASLDRLGDAWIRSKLKHSRYWHLAGSKEEKRLTDQYIKDVHDVLSKQAARSGPAGKSEESARARKGGRVRGAYKKHKNSEPPAAS